MAPHQTEQATNEHEYGLRLPVADCATSYLFVGPCRFLLPDDRPEMGHFLRAAERCLAECLEAKDRGNSRLCLVVAPEVRERASVFLREAICTILEVWVLSCVDYFHPVIKSLDDLSLWCRLMHRVVNIDEAYPHTWECCVEGQVWEEHDLMLSMGPLWGMPEPPSEELLELEGRLERAEFRRADKKRHPLDLPSGTPYCAWHEQRKPYFGLIGVVRRTWSYAYQFEAPGLPAEPTEVPNHYTAHRGISAVERWIKDHGQVSDLAQPANRSHGEDGGPLQSVRLYDPQVVLGAAGDRPNVRGLQKERLTLPQYDVVKALLEAGERGLSKDELGHKSNHGDARKILKRLADSDEDWKAVIQFGGKPGGRYRIGRGS